VKKIHILGAVVPCGGPVALVAGAGAVFRIHLTGGGRPARAGPMKVATPTAISHPPRPSRGRRPTWNGKRIVADPRHSRRDPTAARPIPPPAAAPDS
jgi:hypothetical protein